MYSKNRNTRFAIRLTLVLMILGLAGVLGFIAINENMVKVSGSDGNISGSLHNRTAWEPIAGELTEVSWDSFSFKVEHATVPSYGHLICVANRQTGFTQSCEHHPRTFENVEVVELENAFLGMIGEQVLWRSSGHIQSREDDLITYTYGDATCVIQVSTGKNQTCSLIPYRADLAIVHPGGFVVSVSSTHVVGFDTDWNELWRYEGSFRAQTEQGFITQSPHQVCHVSLSGTPLWCVDTLVGSSLIQRQATGLLVQISLDTNFLLDYQTGEVRAISEMTHQYVEGQVDSYTFVSSAGIEAGFDFDHRHYSGSTYNHRFPNGMTIVTFGEGVMTQTGVFIEFGGGILHVGSDGTLTTMGAPGGYELLNNPYQAFFGNPQHLLVSTYPISGGQRENMLLNFSALQSIIIPTALECNPTSSGIYGYFEDGVVYLDEQTSEIVYSSMDQSGDWRILTDMDYCAEGFSLRHENGVVNVGNYLTQDYLVLNPATGETIGEHSSPDEFTVVVGGEAFTRESKLFVMRSGNEGVLIAQEGFSGDSAYNHYLLVGYDGTLLLEADNITYNNDGWAMYESEGNWHWFDLQTGQSGPLNFMAE
jgi:hypothetical protein